MKAAIYGRISTTKELQEHGLESQIRTCREFIETRGLGADGVRIFTDQASGRKENRPALRELMQAAAMKQVRVVVVFKLDRLTRGGIGPMFRTIEALDGFGCRIYSVSEPWFDPESPTWDLILSILAWVAKFESRAIGERVASGISSRKAEAKERGERFLWGRARVSKVVKDPTLPARALELHSKGLSWSKVAAGLGGAPDDG